MFLKAFIITLALSFLGLEVHEPKRTVHQVELKPELLTVLSYTPPTPQPKTTTPKLQINNANKDHRKLAHAIDKLYKHITYEEALHIVQIVYRQAHKHSIKPTLVIGLIAAESSFNRKARSAHGAMGLTQVVPKWHHDKIKGRNLFDPNINIEVGLKVLSACLKKYNRNTNRALACYNGATEQPQQQAYINKVNRKANQILQLAGF